MRVTAIGRRSRFRKLSVAVATFLVPLGVIAAPMGTTQPLHAAPVAGAVKTRVGRPVVDLRSILDQTAAVISGDVTDVAYTYSDTEGPRTRVTLSKVVTHAGEKQPASLTLPIFGGPLPEGGFLDPSHTPHFEVGGSYVVFLRNTDWYMDPTVDGCVFRVVPVGPKRVLVDTDGLSILAINAVGVKRGAAFLATNRENDKKGIVQSLVAGKSYVDLAAEAVEDAGLIADVKVNASSMGITIGGAFAPKNFPFPGKSWRTQ